MNNKTNIEVYQFPSQDRYWRGKPHTDSLSYVAGISEEVTEEALESYIDEHQSDFVEEYDKSLVLYDKVLDKDEYNDTVLANSSEKLEEDEDIRVVVFSYDADLTDLVNSIDF